MNKRLNIFCGFALFLTEVVEVIAGHRMFQNLAIMIVLFVFMSLRIRRELPFTAEYNYLKGSGITLKFGLLAIFLHALIVSFFKPIVGLLEYQEIIKDFGSVFLGTVPDAVATFIIDLVFMIPCSLVVPLFFIGMTPNKREDLLDDEVY